MDCKELNGDGDVETPLISRRSSPFLLDQPRVGPRPSSSNLTSQVAIVGSNVCPIESLDYELIENDFFKQDWRTRDRAQIFQYLFLKWTLCFLVGLIAGIIGCVNNIAVENIAGVKFVITSNLMLAREFRSAFLVFATTNFVLTMFSSIVTTFVSPAAAGSGIPEK